MRHPTAWNDSDIARVAEMLDDALSMSKIAARFHLSRNAIIGRVHRTPSLMAIVERNKKIHAAQRGEARPVARVAARPAAAVPRVPAPVVPRIPAPAPELPTSPTPLGVPLEAIGCGCRFPVESDVGRRGVHLFCGAQANGSYCAYHELICRPVTERRKR